MGFIIISFAKLRKEELSYIPKATTIQIADIYNPKEVTIFRVEMMRHYYSKKFLTTYHLRKLQPQQINEDKEAYDPVSCF